MIYVIIHTVCITISALALRSSFRNNSKFGIGFNAFAVTFNAVALVVALINLK